MSTTRHYICERDVDDPNPGKPAVYSCTLELVDDGLIFSSGAWKTAGPSPEKLFETRSGKWQKSGPHASLNATDGNLAKRIIMENIDDASGKLTGNGLFGGFVVFWKKVSF